MDSGGGVAPSSSRLKAGTTPLLDRDSNFKELCRHCEERSDEAIHSFFARRDGLLRGACHRARVRATRWLAMTVSKHAIAPPRRDAPELCNIFRPNRGRRECRVLAAPAVSRAICAENTHTSIQVQSEHSGIPRTMVLRLMPRSPRRRIRLVTVVGELTVLPNPVGLTKTSADLTPATGARTTRFCRTHQRRTSVAPAVRSRVLEPALRSRSRPTLPRPPHLIPTCLTIRIRPSRGMRRRGFYR
jgi:hypothetical protein